MPIQPGDGPTVAAINRPLPVFKHNKNMPVKRKDGTYTISPAEWVDVTGGICTYGQMVELGRVLDRINGSVVDDAGAVRSLIRCLHPGVDLAIDFYTIRYALAIVEGVRFWRKQESERLSYTPTGDEKLAGYEKLARETGATGVAITVAEKFGVSGGPDEVFGWPYATVFQVLRIDLERSNFQKRLQKIADDKRQRSGRLNRR